MPAGAPLDLTALSDDQLMARLVEGHLEDSLAELQRRHRPALRQMIAALIQDDDLAQDVTQETFERVFLHCDRYVPRDQFRSWLCEIARNQALSALRSRRRAPRPFSSFATDDEEGTPFEQSIGREAPRELEERELMEAFDRAVGALPERYQQVFRLCVLQGLQYREAGALLNVPTGTVAIRLMRARKLLFGALAQHFDRLRRPPACLQT